MPGPHILIATRHYPPDGGALSFRMEHLAKTLADDHTVTVLASQPNRYGAEPRAPRRTRDGAITVRRVSAGRVLRSRGKLARLLTESIGAVIISFAALRRRRADLVVVSTPPLTYVLPGWVMKRLGRRRVVLDVRDLWLDWAEETGVVASGLVLGLLRRFERAAIRSADHITVTTFGFADELSRRFDVPAERITVVYNGLDDEMAPAAASRPLPGPDGSIEVLYAGNLGPSQNIAALADGIVAALDAAPRLRLTVVGNGSQAGAIAAIGHERFTYLPAVDRGTLQEIYGRADAYLLHLADLEVYRHTVPSKTFEYAGYGRPIVCGVRGEARRIAARHADCYFFEPDDAASFASAVARLVAGQQPDNANTERGEASELLRSSRRADWLAVIERLT